MKRCEWATGDETYLAYHDTEWGVPVHDDKKLFEMLILEGAQAGLNWLTVLKRRDNYRQAYDGFDPVKIAGWNQRKFEALLRNPGIIRNRLKIEAARTNARTFLKIIEEFGSFDEFIWSFIGGRPMHNSWQDVREVPATTPESDRMSRELKKRGVQICRSNHLLRFHAGSRHGERSRC